MSRSGFLLLATVIIGGLALQPAAAQVNPTPPPSDRTEQARAFVQRFRAANTTHDGKLTRPQAEAAKMTAIVRYFGDIDAQHKGFITLEDIRVFAQKRRAAANPTATE
jgi:hypothetical protein